MYWLYVFVIINALFMLYLMLSLMFIVDILSFIVLACAAALMYCRLYDVFAVCIVLMFLLYPCFFCFLFVCCFVVLCMRVYVFRSRHELHCVEGCALYKLSYY